MPPTKRPRKTNAKRPRTTNAKRPRTTGRPLNAYFQTMLGAKARGAASFQYRGNTYVRGQRGGLVVYRAYYPMQTLQMSWLKNGECTIKSNEKMVWSGIFVKFDGTDEWQSIIHPRFSINVLNAFWDDGYVIFGLGGEVLSIFPDAVPNKKELHVFKFDYNGEELTNGRYLDVKFRRDITKTLLDTNDEQNDTILNTVAVNYFVTLLETAVKDAQRYSDNEGIIWGYYNVMSTSDSRDHIRAVKIGKSDGTTLTLFGTFGESNDLSLHTFFTNSMSGNSMSGKSFLQRIKQKIWSVPVEKPKPDSPIQKTFDAFAKFYMSLIEKKNPIRFKTNHISEKTLLIYLGMEGYDGMYPLYFQRDLILD